jgi:hypothetical protein
MMVLDLTGLKKPLFAREIFGDYVPVEIGKNDADYDVLQNMIEPEKVKKVFDHLLSNKNKEEITNKTYEWPIGIFKYNLPDEVKLIDMTEEELKKANN